MLPTLPHWLRILPVALLLSLSGHAQSRDSLRFNRHTLGLNLTPGIRREVQLFYEWPLNRTSGLELVIGGRVPSGQRDYDTAPLELIWSSYDHRYQALPYEKGWAAGLNWKKYSFRNPAKRFVPFVSAGLLSRFGYFNDRCYAERYGTGSASWAQAFSLRKFETSARVVWGARRHFLLNPRGAAVSLQFSGGFGYGVRFGTAFVRRNEANTDYCRFIGTSGFSRTNYTENFVARFVELPVNLKIGYSWGL
jgi:hypothetical protein